MAIFDLQQSKYTAEKMAFYTFMDWVTQGRTPDDIRTYLDTHRSELEPPDDTGMTAWHHAAFGGWIEIIRHLRAAGYANVTAVDSEGSTAIHSLVRCSRPRVDFASGLDLLVDLGVPIDGVSELLYAGKARNENAMIAILERGVKLNLNGQNKSPLLIPGLSMATARRLLLLDSRLLTYSGPSAHSPLSAAISMDNTELVIALCDMGATLEGLDQSKMSLLFREWYAFHPGNRMINIPLLKITTMADVEAQETLYGVSAIEMANLVCRDMVKTIVAMFPGLKWPPPRDAAGLINYVPLDPATQYPTEDERYAILFDVYFAQSLLERLIVWS